MERSAIKMNSGSNGFTGYLDRIRRARGVNFCRNTLLRTERANRQNAVRLINDGRLLFATLFVLQPEIRERGLYQELSKRNRTALNICQKIMSAKYPSDGTESEISLKSEDVHSVMLWMLNTGAEDDGLSAEFDQILDITASVLVKTHHEKTVLPIMADLIFRRNRRDVYNHDLIWAFFQARDPQSLKYLASRLLSLNKKDVELACLLLNIPENTPMTTSRDKQKEYDDYLDWLNENSPYVYFTGESLQLTNAPSICGVNQEAKYLCKNISPRYNTPLTPLTEEELVNLEHFHEAKEEDQAVLATFSNSLHSQNESSWNEWMHYPVGRQIDLAKYGRRELV